MGENGKASDFGEMVSTSIGGLFSVCTMQMRAMISLSRALEKDPAVSEETRAAAARSLKEVDKMIEVMQESLSKIGDIDFKAGFKD